MERETRVAAWGGRRESVPLRRWMSIVGWALVGLCIAWVLQPYHRYQPATGLDWATLAGLIVYASVWVYGTRRGLLP